ncbi:DNA-formamidopyrimidine glycosylase [Candidatus Parcubacteria bacterium]|nr:DNA-formamidopyrimidine glycosylase [Candidatus Parcubacteria bacterium]
MPELPEVQTTVADLNKANPPILGSFFVDFWIGTPKLVKYPKKIEEFKKQLLNKKISKIWRRGKNIIFSLENSLFLLIHQKLTGHLLYGKWERKEEKWIPKIDKKELLDPHNLYLRAIFFLSNGWQLALSDLRKFAKIMLLGKKELEQELSQLGPEPLDPGFTFQNFKELLLKKKGEIKKVLMDQTTIAGIGNIYSDEILWHAKVHPKKKINDLSEKEIRQIYRYMKKILQKAISLGGESISDYRRPNGEKGKFDQLRKVYRREGEKCFRCKSKIKRIKIGARSSYFCPYCQKL